MPSITEHGVGLLCKWFCPRMNSAWGIFSSLNLILGDIRFYCISLISYSFWEEWYFPTLVGSKAEGRVFNSPRRGNNAEYHWIWGWAYCTRGVGFQTNSAWSLGLIIGDLGFDWASPINCSFWEKWLSLPTLGINNECGKGPWESQCFAYFITSSSRDTQILTRKGKGLRKFFYVLLAQPYGLLI